MAWNDPKFRRKYMRKYMKDYREEKEKPAYDPSNRNMYNMKQRKLQFAYRRTPKSKFLDYKKWAGRRGFSFDLNMDQFMKFWQEPCKYCGGSIDTIGIDRVDNSIGYAMENIVSCCKICNFMKRSLPLDIFIEHCRRVSNFNLKNGE